MLRTNAGTQAPKRAQISYLWQRHLAVRHYPTFYRKTGAKTGSTALILVRASQLNNNTRYVQTDGERYGAKYAAFLYRSPNRLWQRNRPQTGRVKPVSQTVGVCLYVCTLQAAAQPSLAVVVQRLLQHPPGLFQPWLYHAGRAGDGRGWRRRLGRVRDMAMDASGSRQQKRQAAFF